MLYYRVFKERINTIENGQYSSYGLAAYTIDRYGIRCVCRVSDVSSDRAFMQRLARDCTKGQLNAVHIYDVIVDRLS